MKTTAAELGNGDLWKHVTVRAERGKVKIGGLPVNGVTLISGRLTEIQHKVVLGVRELHPETLTDEEVRYASTITLTIAQVPVQVTAETEVSLGTYTAPNEPWVIR